MAIFGLKRGHKTLFETMFEPKKSTIFEIFLLNGNNDEFMTNKTIFGHEQQCLANSGLQIQI